MTDGDQVLIAIYIFIATCLFGIPCVKGIAQCSPAMYRMCCKRKKKPKKPKIEPERNPIGRSQFKATRVQVQAKKFEPTRAERPEDLNRNTFLQERKRRQAFKNRRRQARELELASDLESALESKLLSVLVFFWRNCGLDMVATRLFLEICFVVPYGVMHSTFSF